MNEDDEEDEGGGEDENMEDPMASDDAPLLSRDEVWEHAADPSNLLGPHENSIFAMEFEDDDDLSDEDADVNECEEEDDFPINANVQVKDGGWWTQVSWGHDALLERGHLNHFYENLCQRLPLYLDLQQSRGI
jgi:hypothetical protein